MVTPNIQVQLPKYEANELTIVSVAENPGLFLVTDYDSLREYVRSLDEVNSLAKRWAEESPGTRIYVLQPILYIYKPKS